MAKQKLTTEEILAKARQSGAQGPGGGGEAAAAPESASPEKASGSASEPAKASAGKTAAKPGSTADILAAARAQKPGGAAGKAGSASKPASQPASTSDVLAAARSQGAGAAKKPAAKPGSTSDILAAARATAGGSAAKPARPAVGKASSEPSSAPRSAGQRPSVQEMVQAARKGAPIAAAAAKPKLPARPPLPSRKSASAPTRRSFFGSAIVWVTEPFLAAWVAMGAIAATWGLATARFMMPNMIVEPPTKFKVGPPSDYPPGTVSTKWKAARGIWVVNAEYDGRNLVYALATVCTHLGCTPNWLEGEQKFKCPCHGSGFYITGINFEGPAPRPLERMGIRLAEDGSLEVDKSVKFQEELGQWEDAASFVEVA